MPKWGDFSPRLPFLGKIAPLPVFDWQGVASPNIPREDLIIYEMHVRGFTKHSSSEVQSPGTYAGLIEKIPYLQQLGINAVELMPIYEFDETQTTKVYSSITQHRINYWGYNPISFFIPMSQYAAQPEESINEFKTMVRELHRAGIEVILDVVYNHTCENKNYMVSYRGIDLGGYFILNEHGGDLDYTGCGNTFQANGTMGKRAIIDSLIYWVQEMKIDGFRFDLTSILTRGIDGRPLERPPILELINQEPLLKRVKWIAEPWDAAGLNQSGQFSKMSNWAEWNGSFRDHVRRFIKGTDQEVGYFATALSGSEHFGFSNFPQTSINFITAHDGFCLRDLVTYQHKHNIDNGENNLDGAEHNCSWNCGAEGPTQNLEIHERRERQMRNFWLTLFLAQGIPMILMGDEFGHTRKGNNNPYVQDNEINWFDWNICKKNQSIVQFVAFLIQFRKANPVFHKTHFLKPDDIEWHGVVPLHPDWKTNSRFIAFTLKDDQHPIYAAFNTNSHAAQISLPSLADDKKWHLVINTADSWDKINTIPKTIESIEMLPYSSILARAD